MSGEYVFCPLHDQKIDLNTGIVQEPDEGCVDVYEVEVTDGTYIYVCKWLRQGLLDRCGSW